MLLRVIQSKGDEVPTKIGDHVWSGIKSFSDKDESTIRKTLFIAARPDGLKNLAVFDSEFLEYRETDQKYVFTIITNPLVLKDQDLKVHLISSKREKIAAVQLVENQEGKLSGTSKKNSFESQSIGGPVWGGIAMLKKFFANSPQPPSFADFKTTVVRRSDEHHFDSPRLNLRCFETNMMLN